MQPLRGAGDTLFARHLIESAELTGSRLQLGVRLNWYRALPLSCVERLEVRVDGEIVDPARTTVELDGVRGAAAELAHRDDRWWHVLDTAHVRVELDRVLDRGTHVVEVVLGSRIPYLVGPDATAVVIVDRARTTVPT